MDKTEVKQVEELARALCNFSANTICPDCADDCFFKEYARRAVAKGWCRQSEWISVEERLPDTTEKILVYCSNGEILPAKYIRVQGLEFWFEETYSCHNITHWMPLPEPPKKGRER